MVTPHMYPSMWGWAEWPRAAITLSKVRSWDELPENARNYVEYVERAIGCHIGYVSVGAERDSLIIR